MAAIVEIPLQMVISTELMDTEHISIAVEMVLLFPIEVKL